MIVQKRKRGLKTRDRIITLSLRVCVNIIEDHIKALNFVIVLAVKSQKCVTILVIVRSVLKRNKPCPLERTEEKVRVPFTLDLLIQCRSHTVSFGCFPAVVGDTPHQESLDAVRSCPSYAPHNPAVFNSSSLSTERLMENSSASTP